MSVARSEVVAPAAGGSASAEAAPPSLSRADRWQPMLLLGAIGAGLGLAKVMPGVAGELAWLVNVGVFAMIYLVMLGLDVRRVADAFGQRRFLSIAVALNFVVNPVLAWVLGQVFLSNQPDLRVGLLLFLVTPCIGWYLLFTELARGDTSLGVSLLGVNLILQILLLPVYLLIFEGRATGVDLGGIAASVALFLLAPAVLAAVTRGGLGWRGGDAASIQGVVDRAHLKTVALVVVITAMFASQAEAIFDDPGVVFRLVMPMVTFFAVAFALALVVGWAAGMPYDQTALLAFTTTSRNSEASLAIAATAFASPLVSLTVVIGPVVELPLLVLMVRVLLARRPEALVGSGLPRDAE